MTRARHSEDVPPNDDVSKSTTDSDTDSLFDDEADAATDTDLESLLADEDSDEEEEEEDHLFEDEVRRPPECYQAGAANLDVQRLRKERYSPRTQARLDWVKEHHDRYEQYLNHLQKSPAPEDYRLTACQSGTDRHTGCPR
jgi:hypothetical protein